MSAGKNIPKMVSMFMYVNQQVALSLISGPSLIYRWSYSSDKRKTQQSNVQMSNNESDSSIPFSNCGRRIRMDGDKIEKNCYFSQTQFPSTFLLFLSQASKTMWHFQHISHIVCNISHIVCNITSAAYQHSPNLIYFLADLDTFLDFQP